MIKNEICMTTMKKKERFDKNQKSNVSLKNYGDSKNYFKLLFNSILQSMWKKYVKQQIGNRTL